jgi:hypothetical protein
MLNYKGFLRMNFDGEELNDWDSDVDGSREEAQESEHPKGSIWPCCGKQGERGVRLGSIAIESSILNIWIKS